MSIQLIKKIRVTTTMKLLSGLHIGDSKDTVEIGGVDNPVIRRKDNLEPYLPGSSLKGKMRCLLEQIAGAAKIGDNEAINNEFGIADKKMDTKRSRIIFRDSYLTKESVKLFKDSHNTDMPFTEIKFENSIDRITGVAKDPRQQERIPAGAIFDIEFIVNVFDDDIEGSKTLAMLKKGIHALQNDYIGGSGSRGYGQIEFGEVNEEPIEFLTA